MRKTALAAALTTSLLIALPAGTASAAAPPTAGCVGQFFSQHAGLVPATGGEESVGGFIRGAAQEFGSAFGAEISRGARIPTRTDCGL